ncbi:MAG: alpha-hydroxy-acid oxidizing protein [Armatimonadetes bacterium]|nr:alpha-hydroxy-acid oxidizing protein [Armatimonadota bacterium]
MTKLSRAVASPRVVSIEDFRSLAGRRLPKAVFDDLDGGAEGEVTLRENCRAFHDVTFRPRHAVAVPHCDLRTRVLGFDLSSARAVGAAGTAYILSTISGHRLEDVKAASSGHVFYQLYLMGGREAAEPHGGRGERPRGGFNPSPGTRNFGVRRDRPAPVSSACPVEPR